MQVVVSAPVLYLLFTDKVHGADKLHSLEMVAVELWHHGLHLTAVYHAHEDSFDNVVKVMTQRNFVAAQLLSLAVKIASSHAGAEVAGVVFHVINGVENISLKNSYGDIHELGVALDNGTVLGAVAWVHYKKYQLKGEFSVAVYFLKELCHKHRVLAA